MPNTLLRLATLVLVSLSFASPLLAETDAARLMGKPKFSEGKGFGYYVWKDGDTWKVRWTTFGAQHRFNGRVELDGGQLMSFKRIDVDTERKILAPGRASRVVRGPRGRARVVGGRAPVVASRDEDKIEQETEQLIRFAALTDDDLDGFEFKLSDEVRRVRFFLSIDGAPRPLEIEVGAANFKPNEDPLVVRLK